MALWSGPAGGVGKTTLALLLSAYAAERGIAPLLVALAEPAVSAYLTLPRMPNVTAFFETGDLGRAVQTVGWEGGPTLRVILGPARPSDGAVTREQVTALVKAAAVEEDVTVVDLPALPPGGNVWSLEPLTRATDLVLVALPTVTGVAAVVESLATLRDIGAPGRVHLVLSHRSGGGVSRREFVNGVRSLWGSCPEVAAEVPYVPSLAAALDRGELPDFPPLTEAVARLAERAAGLARVERSEEGAPPERTSAPAGDRPRRRLGRLITLEVTD